MLQDELFHKNESVLTVISSSMEPVIYAGDKVFVQPVFNNKLISGDIILFTKGNFICTHRFICMQKYHGMPKMILKGDHLKGFDLPVADNHFLGKVTFVIRDEKKIDLTETKYSRLNHLFGVLLKYQWKLQYRIHLSCEKFHKKVDGTIIKILIRLFHPINCVFSYYMSKLNQWQINES